VAPCLERVYRSRSVTRFGVRVGFGRRLAALAAAAAACSCVPSAAAATAPRQALIEAEQKTAAVQSIHVSLVERLTQGSQTLVTRMSGVQETPRKAGSFVYDFSQIQPTLGVTDAIALGSKTYFHYGGLDALRARQPKLRRWVVVDSKAALGVNPWGLGVASVQAVKAITGLRSVGRATDAGVSVVRYAGRLDFGKALGLVPQLQQLLSHLPSSAAALAHTRGDVEFWVGSDGYLHRVGESFGLTVSGQAPLHVSLTMSFGQFGAGVGAIVAPPAADVMTLAAFNRVLGAIARSPSSKLGAVVLRAAQVGAGYALQQLPGGQLVQGQATLDLCGFSFPSESLRTARLQVAYRAPGKSLALSNEVVSYRPGGARQALREITHAAAACPHGPVQSTVPGVGTVDVTYRLQRLRDARLLPGSLALVVRVSGTINGTRGSTTEVVVYQVRGDLLSVVYASGGTVPELRTFGLTAAGWSAADLKLHA
jgi:hypothetical protein